METFTDEQMEQMKLSITAKLECIGRPGMDKLIEWMENNGFFTAPCSTNYHLATEGGLARHSLNVCDTIINMARALCSLENAPDFNSLVLVALLHDLGKCGDFNKPMYVENVLKSGKRSESKPFESNPNLLYIPHEVRSVVIAERFIHLTEEEEHAILYHNGTYTGLGYEWKGKEKILDLLLHWSDMFVSHITEVEKNGSVETDS